jgi:hypothetical protein
VDISGAGGAVADEGQGDAAGALVLLAEGAADGQRDQRAEMADEADDPRWQVAHVQAAVPAAGQPFHAAAGGGDHAGRRHAADQERAEVADGERHPVALAQCRGGADGRCLIAGTRQVLADADALADHLDDLAVGGAGERHEVIQAEQVLPAVAIDDRHRLPGQACRRDVQ